MYMFYLIIIFCYIITAYGACNVIVFGDGPFYIFSKLREVTYNIHPHFGKLFSCMMCLPANFGWICSLLNYLFIPISFTPFNIIFNDYPNLWWLILLCDGAFTSGIVYLIYIFNEFLEKKIEYYESNTYRYENNTEGFDLAEKDDNVLLVEDITKQVKDGIWGKQIDFEECDKYTQLESNNVEL